MPVPALARWRPALALLLAGGVAWVFSAHGPQAGGTQLLALGLAGLVMSVPLLAWVVGAGGPEAAAPDPPRWSALALGVGASLVFLASAEVEREWSPPLVTTEARSALVVARNWLDAPNDLVRANVSRLALASYNTGLAPLMVPVVAAFGPNPTAYHLAATAFFALCLGTGLAMFVRREGGGGGPLPLPILLLPLGTLMVFLPSLRTLKWHATSMAAALALLGLTAAWTRPRQTARLVACLLLLLGSVVVYHVNLLFLVLALALPLRDLLRRHPDEPRRSLLWTGLLVVSLAASAAWLAWSSQIGHGALSERVRTETGHSAGVWQSMGAEVVLRLVADVPGRFFSVPALALVLLGLGVALRRGWERPVSGMALLALAAALAVDLRFLSIGDPAWHCWMLIPLLWMAALGLREAASALGRLLPRGMAAALLLLGLGGLAWAEGTHFDRAGIGEKYELTPQPTSALPSWRGCVGCSWPRRRRQVRYRSFRSPSSAPPKGASSTRCPSRNSTPRSGSGTCASSVPRPPSGRWPAPFALVFRAGIASSSLSRPRKRGPIHCRLRWTSCASWEPRSKWCRCRESRADR